MDKPCNPSPHLHYLLTTLGTSPQKTTYVLNDKPAEAEYSSLALLQLLKPEGPLPQYSTVPREDVWEDFSEEVERLGVIAEPIDIPDWTTVCKWLQWSGL